MLQERPAEKLRENAIWSKTLRGAFKLFERRNFWKGGDRFISFHKRKFQARLENSPDVSYEESRYAKRLKILSGAIFEVVPFRLFPQNAELTLLIDLNYILHS